MKAWLLVLIVAMNAGELVGTAVLVTSLRRLLVAVHTELKPNHGTSTRDAVDRLEATVNRLETASELAAVATATAQQTADMLTTTISIATEVAVQNRARLVELAGNVAEAAADAVSQTPRRR